VRGIFILRNIHVAGLSFDGRQTVYPRQLFEAADRLCLATTPLSEHLAATLIPINIFSAAGNTRPGAAPAPDMIPEIYFLPRRSFSATVFHPKKIQ
jgi:hypothetical protein